MRVLTESSNDSYSDEAPFFLCFFFLFVDQKGNVQFQALAGISVDGLQRNGV